MGFQVITNLFPKKFFYSNQDVGGVKTSEMIAQGSAVDSLFRSDQAENMLCVWEISNELYGGTSVTTAYTNFVHYCRQRQSYGWKVIALTVLPRSGGIQPPNFETNRLTINEWMRQEHASFADGLADVGSDPIIGCENCPTNTAYYQDRTHLTSTGYALVAKRVSETVRSLSR